jgi:hypothetical protein
LVTLEAPLVHLEGPVRYLSAVVRVAIPLMSEPMRLAVPTATVTNSFDPDLHAIDFVNLLRAVFQATLTNTHIQFEHGLHQWCFEREIVVKASHAEHWRVLMSKMEGKLSEEDLNELKEFRPPAHVSSQDVTDAVIFVLPKDQQKRWRRYFLAFRTVRNKLSHPPAPLTKYELDVVRGTPFESLLHGTDLKLDFHCCVAIMQDLITFYDEIDRAAPLPVGTASSMHAAPAA